MAGLVTLERVCPRARVLVVTNMWPHSGNPTYGIFVKRQIDSLLEAGVAADVLFIRGYESATAYAVAAAKLAAWSSSSSRRYRLVHAHGGETALAARCYLRAPLVVSYCGDDLLGTYVDDDVVTLRSRVVSGALRLHSTLTQRTITKSREMEERLPRRVRERNTVIPNGVDEHVFRPLDRAAARRDLGWPEALPVALFAADPGVLRKRYALAQTACHEAKSVIPTLELRVAAGIEPEKMPTYLNAADCLVLTSAAEGSPNVVKEALMCNLPVVATRVGDVEELLAGVEPSCVCESSAADLGRAIAAVMRDRARSNGRDRSSHLTQSAIARRVLRVYAQVDPQGDWDALSSKILMSETQ